MITTSLSLPGRLFLLFYDVERGKLTRSGHERAMTVKAAALTELLLSGHLADDNGDVAVGSERRTPTDPVLAGVLAEVSDGRKRSWKAWISRRPKPVRDAVRDQLAANGWIRVEERRILGLFPADRIVVSNPQAIGELADVVRAALSGGPTSSIAARDLALVALAAAGEASPVLDSRQRREHKARLAELTERAGPTPTALRKAIRASRAATSAAVSGGGGGGG